MFTTLVASGCSFTKAYCSGWVEKLAAKSTNATAFNLGRPAAGNMYIADSIQHHIRTTTPDPETTLVAVMWSGPGRIDMTVSAEYSRLIEEYVFRHCLGRNTHYVMSGGELGEWEGDMLIRPLFVPVYKAKDHKTLMYDTAKYIEQTEEFLAARGYKYVFMSYVDYWKHEPGFVSDMDLSIGYHCPELVRRIIKKPSQWVWTNDNYECIYEFAKKMNLLAEDGFHPNEEAYDIFVDQFLLPKVRELFQ